MTNSFKALTFALCLAVPAAAQAATVTFTAVLNGANESPANTSPGTGTATVVYDDVASMLQVSATFQDLLSPTTNAHIHCCTAVAGTGVIGVATPTPTFPGFPAGVTSGSYSREFDLTLASSYNAAFVTANGGTAATAQAALVAGLFAGKTYFNIHSSQFGGGEIRGFLQVPEPGTLLLVGGGLLGLVFRSRKAS